MPHPEDRGIDLIGKFGGSTWVCSGESFCVCSQGRAWQRRVHVLRAFLLRVLPEQSLHHVYFPPPTLVVQNCWEWAGKLLDSGTQEASSFSSHVRLCIPTQLYQQWRWHLGFWLSLLFLINNLFRIGVGKRHRGKLFIEGQPQRPQWYYDY